MLYIIVDSQVVLKGLILAFYLAIYLRVIYSAKSILYRKEGIEGILEFTNKEAPIVYTIP